MGFRKGDRVSIMGTLDYDQQGEKSLFISLDGWSSAVIIDQDKVTLVEPMISAGETVIVDGKAWEVIAVHNGLVWAKRDDGSKIFPISDITRPD